MAKMIKVVYVFEPIDAMEADEEIREMVKTLNRLIKTTKTTFKSSGAWLKDTRYGSAGYIGDDHGNTVKFEVVAPQPPNNWEYYVEKILAKQDSLSYGEARDALELSSQDFEADGMIVIPALFDSNGTKLLKILMKHYMSKKPYLVIDDLEEISRRTSDFLELVQGECGIKDAQLVDTEYWPLSKKLLNYRGKNYCRRMLGILLGVSAIFFPAVKKS